MVPTFREGGLVAWAEASGQRRTSGCAGSGGTGWTLAGPESARDIRRSARTCHLFRPSSGPLRTGWSGALRSRTPWMTTSGPRTALCGGRVVVPTLCVGNW